MVARKSAAPKKVSKWSLLVAEANKDYKAPKPYEFDAYDPPVLITAPDTLERTLALASLRDLSAGVDPAEFKTLLQALVGEESFDLVWDKVRALQIPVVMSLIEDMGVHFDNQDKNGAGEVPGGVQDS